MPKPAINKPLLLLSILCAAFYFLFGCVAAPVRDAEILEAREIPSGQKAKLLQLKKVMVKIKRGTVIGSWQTGLICLPGGEINMNGNKVVSTIGNSEINGRVKGNRLKGRLEYRGNYYRFDIKISSDGMSFEGGIDCPVNRTCIIKGMRKE